MNLYASIPNHLLNFIRYIFAFVLVFGVFPYFIFSRQYKDRFENIVNRFLRMTLLIIAIGYGLVITALFEFLGIIFFLMAAFIFSYIRRHGLPEVNKFFNSIHTFLYNLADGIVHPKDIFLGFMRNVKLKVHKTAANLFKGILNIGDVLLILYGFIYSGYLRLYDVYLHAAPALSDGNVTLAWLKYIQNRILFYDGIYPQGFHICLAVIQKFSAADPLYILKYAGPMNGILIALGLYFVISRLTSRRGPAICSVLIYGVLGQYLSGEWVRQGATNSQEFAFVFVIPALYFFYKYLESLDKKYLYTTLAGIAVTGLVHTLAYAFTAGGIVVMYFMALLVDFKKYYKVFAKVLVMGITSGVIMALPLGVGIISGLEFHGTSAEFLTSQVTDVAKPVLKISDYAAIGSILLLYIYTFISRRKRKELIMEKCFAAFGAFAFLLYYLGAYLTKSEVLSARAGDLWALVAPLSIGLGVYVTGQAIRNIKWKRVWEMVLCSALIICSLTYFTPTPILPYKMQYDENLEQYLRITGNFRPTEWRIVAQNEMYAVVYGVSFIDLLPKFLNGNNPEDKIISFISDGQRTELKDQDIFIFYEKKVFRTDFDNLKDEYDIREQEMPVLKDWIDRYGKTHDNISIFYDSENITVYQIHQTPDRDEVMDTIW